MDTVIAILRTVGEVMMRVNSIRAVGAFRQFWGVTAGVQDDGDGNSTGCCWIAHRFNPWPFPCHAATVSKLFTKQYKLVSAKDADV